MLYKRLFFLLPNLNQFLRTQPIYHNTQENWRNSNKSIFIIPNNHNGYLDALNNQTRLTILNVRPLNQTTRKFSDPDNKKKEKKRKQSFEQIIIPIPIYSLPDDDDEIPRRPRNSVKRRSQISSEGNFRLEDNVKSFNFTSIGGYTEVKKELRQVVDFLLNQNKYKMYGVRLPKGLLLEGPPGNGKTLLARGLAGESNTSFIVTVGSEFNEKFVGVGAGRIRELFNFAKENEPCIIFIDELDALAKRRSGGGDGADSERDQTLNQLLVALDGFNRDDSILVIGATNRADILDKAVLRAGRFDKIITVPNPDIETRREIIKIHLSSKPMEIDVEELAKLTSGFSGAQIENLLNEATLYAIRNNTLPVTIEAIEKIRDKVLLGQSTKKKDLSTIAQKRVAIHEIGHLLMSLQSKTHEKPRKVSIDSDSATALGFTMFEHDDKDDGLYLREYLEDKLKVLLGGRIAEEVIFGLSVSSGALADLESAFSIAKQMVMQYGMGNKIIYPYFSEQYKKEIDDQIHTIINLAYRDTKKTLEDNRLLLIKLSEELYEKRSMKLQEINDFIIAFNKEQYGIN